MHFDIADQHFWFILVDGYLRQEWFCLRYVEVELGFAHFRPVFAGEVFLFCVFEALARRIVVHLLVFIIKLTNKH